MDEGEGQDEETQEDEQNMREEEVFHGWVDVQVNLFYLKLE